MHGPHAGLRRLEAVRFFHAQGEAVQLEITDLARKYAPWSYSKAETAEVCPAQFRHKHLLKTVGSESTSDTKVGIVAHEILEHRVGGKPRTDARKVAVENNPLTSDEQELLKMLEANMEHFLQRFDRFCKTQGVTQMLTEVAWAFTADYRPTEFFAKDAYFRGKLDLGVVTKDQTLFVLDHKSGVAKDLKQDRKKRQQLQAYGVLAVPNLPDIAGVRAGIHFMQGDDPDLRLQWVDFVPVDILKKSYAPWLYGRINECASNLADVRGEDAFPARPTKKMPRGWPCHWCNYQRFCPAFQEKFGGA